MRQAYELGRGARRGTGQPEHARHLQVKRRRAPVRPPGRTIPALFVTFVLGAAAGWWMHATMSSRPAPVASIAPPRAESPPIRGPDGGAARPPGPVRSEPSIECGT